MKSTHQLDLGGKITMEIDWNDVTQGSHAVRVIDAGMGDPDRPKSYRAPNRVEFRTTSEALRELVGILDRLA